MVNELKVRKLFWSIVACVALLASAHADDIDDAEKKELARQETFRSGIEAIVDDLNYGSFDSFIVSINQRDMVERIFGLRLIDQNVKKQFTESLEYSYDDLIMSAFVIPEDGLKATLLGVESRGDVGRAVVRYDLPNFQFNYHEYDLQINKWGNFAIVDWTDFRSGMLFSEGVGRAKVMQAPNEPALRKVVDFQNVKSSELFQFGELLKSARDRRLKRYLEIRDGMDPRFQRQRIVVETSVQLARAVRQRRQMVGALQVMAEHFPDEPLYSLMLLDYFFPQKKYAEANAALMRLSDRLGFDDAAMDARFSATALVMGDTAEAVAYADAALGREPTLELAWWSALNARAALSDSSGAVEALQQLEAEFGYELGPEALQENESYAQLLESSEYKHWRESRK